MKQPDGVTCVNSLHFSTISRMNFLFTISVKCTKGMWLCVWVWACECVYMLGEAMCTYPPHCFYCYQASHLFWGTHCALCTFVSWCSYMVWLNFLLLFHLFTHTLTQTHLPSSLFLHAAPVSAQSITRIWYSWSISMKLQHDASELERGRVGRWAERRNKRVWTAEVKRRKSDWRMKMRGETIKIFHNVKKAS